MIFGDFPINFKIIRGKYFLDFKENLKNFWNRLLEVLEILWWNFGKIARKFKSNLRDVEKKISNDSKKIVETLLGTIEIIRNWCRWYYEKM